MKNIAYLLLFIFVTFCATPTLVTLVDKEADISMAFTANEEENSGKNHIGFEYTLNDSHQNISIHFLQEQMAYNHYYKERYKVVFLEILSPPPKQA